MVCGGPARGVLAGRPTRSPSCAAGSRGHCGRGTVQRCASTRRSPRSSRRAPGRAARSDGVWLTPWIAEQYERCRARRPGAHVRDLDRRRAGGRDDRRHAAPRGVPGVDVPHGAARRQRPAGPHARAARGLRVHAAPTSRRPTDHTLRLGAVQLPRDEFERRLAAALRRWRRRLAASCARSARSVRARLGPPLPPSLCQPARRAVGVVALASRRLPWVLVGVELDDEARASGQWQSTVRWPIGSLRMGLRERRRAFGPSAGSWRSHSLRVCGSVERLGQRPGARLAAPVARERAQGIDGDQCHCGGHVVGHAVDRPAGRREVEEGLGGGGDAQAPLLTSSPPRGVRTLSVVAASRVARDAGAVTSMTVAHRQLAVERRRAGVTQRRARPGSEQRRRPPLLRRRTAGHRRRRHPRCRRVQQPALDHPVDLARSRTRRAEAAGGVMFPHCRAATSAARA